MAEAAFLELLGAAKQDGAVLAFVVTGSRGKRFENVHSDYDLAIFAQEEALASYRARYGAFPYGDLQFFTLASFETHAAWGSDTAYDRYAWAHVEPEFDRTGGVLLRLMDEKSRVPAEHAEKHIHDALDWFINQVYRSLKCYRVGDEVGYRLEAAELVRPFLQAVFCLHERRTVPYYKYLAWELSAYPLEKLNLTGDELVRHLLEVSRSADCRVQQALLREAERVFRADYGETFDAWGENLQFCLAYLGER